MHGPFAHMCLMYLCFPGDLMDVRVELPTDYVAIWLSDLLILDIKAWMVVFMASCLVLEIISNS